jgi:hypothetical protein
VSFGLLPRRGTAHLNVHAQSGGEFFEDLGGLAHEIVFLLGIVLEVVEFQRAVRRVLHELPVTTDEGLVAFAAVGRAAFAANEVEIARRINAAAVQNGDEADRIDIRRGFGTCEFKEGGEDVEVQPGVVAARAKNKERPFFLYYPMILTHNPFQPTPDSPDWDPTLTGENKQQSPKHFADMTAYMDKMVGRVVAKLDELGIRDNTLLIVLGDNGTNTSITSRFKGADYKGGKGTTTSHGTHVPLIVSWPAVIKQGGVSTDLISSTDFLPTLCAAAGVPVPAIVDGVSFLPQLKGEAGTPREWLYTWYSPRQSQDMTVREYTFDHHFKLYRTGQFYDLSSDEMEKQDLATSTLSSEATAAKAKLQAALGHFKEVRPAELDQEFQASGKGKDKTAKKGKKKQGN